MLAYFHHVTENQVVQIATSQNRVVQMHHWTRSSAGADTVTVLTEFISVTKVVKFHREAGKSQ